MNDETRPLMPTRPDPGVPEKAETNGRPHGLINGVRHFLRTVPQVPWAAWLAGLSVWGATLLFLVVSLNETNATARENGFRNQAEDNARANYLNALATYNLERLQYESCLDDIRDAEGNRAWKTRFLNNLEASFPGNEQVALLVTLSRRDIDELIIVGDIDDCIEPGAPPTFEEFLP